ncbi:HD domain-containing protein [Candidatus Micrarchaeota archaeon]|nr:HD domain-containing protein [Candidatus Micrarchaeota archaeon]
MTVIRDALHGGIELSPLEERIVDSPHLQRLRFVKQLSTVYLVYPSALHARFEHSLGTMHLAGKVAGKIGLQKPALETLRLAGLLHDVGHAAFSHLTDELFSKTSFGTHEERGINLVKNSGLAGLIKDAGYSISLLENFLRGRKQGAVIAGELGTDRMDYLLRDGLFTGVGYSHVDVQRLLETLHYQNNELLIGEKGLVAAESLLVSRNFMFNAVYLHPTVRITQAMLVKSIKLGLQDGQVTARQVIEGTDNSVMNALLSGQNPLAQKILARRLFKKAFVLPILEASRKQAGFLSEKDCGKRLEEYLVEEGFSFEDFVVCPPPRRKKTSGLKVLKKNGSVVALEKASRISSLLNFESNRDSLILACPKELVGRLRRKTLSFF